MKRKHKAYSKPKRPFDKARIDEEKGIKKEFGLKNKKEIWKSESKIKTIREKAKKLISASKEDQQAKHIGHEIPAHAKRGGGIPIALFPLQHRLAITLVKCPRNLAIFISAEFQHRRQPSQW